MQLEQLATEPDLEECLSAPNAADIATCGRLQGDIIVLGAAGKMGPSLVRRIVRASAAAATTRRVIAVSRYSSAAAREEIEAAGATAISADLLDPAQVAALPDCPNVLFLAGRKFGSSGDTSLTWAINTMVPAHCARRFSRSRIVAFSTGNVYPFVPATSGGSVEDDPPSPRGEYAQSCLGRERIFEYFARHHGTPTLIYRLNYAVDLRYGVLVDIARKVQSGQPIDRAVSHVNAIWQGDANSYALRALEGCTSPARVLNVTGAEMLPVVEVAEFFGRRFGVAPVFTGHASGEALLNNARACHEWLGPPAVSAETLMNAVAHWLQHGGPTIDKPTKFEVTSGKF
jgi:nucleoside-diphosphate-sugar epimerase